MSQEEKSKESGGTIGDALKLKGISLALPVQNQKQGGPNAPAPAAMKTTPKFKLGAPKIPKRDITAILSSAERLANLEQFRMYSAQIATQMHDSVTFVRAYEQLPEEEQPLYHADFAAIQGDIKEMLSYDEAAYREVAVTAYADALVKTCPDFRRWVLSTLDDLVRVGFLVESSADMKSGGKDGKVRPNGLPMYGGIFNLHESFRKNSSAHKVLASLQNLHERTLEAGHRRHEDQVKELESMAGEQLTLAELKEKSEKAGRIIVQVPDLKRESNLYPLLIESDGYKVTALGAVGAIERVIEDIMEAGASVPVDQLSRDSAGLKGKAVTLHSILRRAILTAEKKEQERVRAAEAKTKAEADFQKRIEGFRTEQEADRKELTPLATLTETKFYFDRKPGIMFYDFGPKPFYEKAWDQAGKRDDRKVYGVMALVERDELSKIRVLQYPERLKGFFAKHAEFAAEGENFSGLGKLGVMLRMGYDKAVAGLSEEERQRRGLVVRKGTVVPKTDTEQAFAATMAASVGEDPSGISVPATPNPAEQAEREPKKPAKKPARKKSSKR